MLLVTTYGRTNLTLRQLALLCGVSKSAADRVIDNLGPKLALQPRKRLAEDAVLIVDGTLIPTRDHKVAEQSKNYRYSTNDLKVSLAVEGGVVRVVRVVLQLVVAPSLGLPVPGLGVPGPVRRAGSRRSPELGLPEGLLVGRPWA
ncbi:hypothetical protein ABID80_006812 [Streptomyces sp. PvP037]